MNEPEVKVDDIGFKNLMADIERGILKIPAFQRDFDWNLERTLRLLDSIAKRYPVGAFLLWDTDQVLGALRNIGNLDLPDVPNGKDVTYVLDRQQRITSLYAAAKGAVINGERYEVFLDLDADPEKDELFGTACPSSKQYIALVDVIGDSAHLITPKLTVKRQARFSEVRDAFREYRFPAIRVRNQSINAVCEMFERVNTGGMELDIFDIMVAKTWTPDFNLRDKWDELVGDLRDTRSGFEGISAKLMLQALACHLRGEVGEKDIVRIDRGDIIPAWGHTRACLFHAIDFLKASAHIPGTRLLSYPSVLLALTHFFDRTNCSTPEHSQTERLLRYIWRAGLTERYGSNPSSTLPADLRLMDCIREGLEGDVPVQRPITPGDVEHTVFRTGSAYCRAILSLLGHAGPVSLKSGVPVILDNSYLAQANSRHYHHVFPRSFLEKQGYSRDEANSIANIMLIPAQENMKIKDSPPSRYMRKLANQAGTHWTRWLRKHLIDARAAKAMMADNYEAFLRARSRVISEYANRAMGLPNETVNEMLATDDDR